MANKDKGFNLKVKLKDQGFMPSCNSLMILQEQVVQFRIFSDELWKNNLTCILHRMGLSSEDDNIKNPLQHSWQF